MNVPRMYKYLRLQLIIVLIAIFSSACIVTVNGSDDSALKETISAQSTGMADLTTQIAELDQTNTSQWGAISYLSTQMPFALGLITPIPPGITITPTPYSSRDQERQSTLSPSTDNEYPPGTRTGVDEIDPVIEAFLEGDIDSRLDLVRFTTCACTIADGLGGPPKCQPGEEDGSVVEAFPVLSGESTYFRPKDIRDVFEFTVKGLFAIYRVPDGAYETDYWPAGEYGIVFTWEERETPHVIIVVVEDGEIIRLEFALGGSPFDVVEARSNEFILPPIR